MCQLKFFRIISLFLGFAMFIFSCTTNKTKKSVNIGLNVETVSEGICITFDNIPIETDRINIFFFNGIENSDKPHDNNSSMSEINGDVLKYIKKTRKVIFPFVQKGQNYTIWISFSSKQRFIDGLANIYSRECIANNGIYFNDGIKLELNKNNSNVTLSSEPKFSKEVQFAPYKYEYTLSLGPYKYDREKITNELQWNFEPEITNDLKESKYLESGNYSAYATVYCNIIYDNITWKVEIAKSLEFIYILNM